MKLDRKSFLQAEKYLPKTFKTLAGLIGVDAALSLVEAEGGNELRLPEIAGGHSTAWARLVEIIGETAATILVGKWHDTRVYVPKCQKAFEYFRTLNIQARFDAGEPFESIRRSHGLTRPAVYRILKKPIELPPAVTTNERNIA